MLFDCVHSMHASVVFQNKSFCIVQWGELYSTKRSLHAAMLLGGYKPSARLYILATVVYVQLCSNDKPEHAKWGYGLHRSNIGVLEYTQHYRGALFSSSSYANLIWAAICTLKYIFSCSHFIFTWVFIGALLVNSFCKHCFWIMPQLLQNFPLESSFWVFPLKEC